MSYLADNKFNRLTGEKTIPDVLTTASLDGSRYVVCIMNDKDDYRKYCLLFLFVSVNDRQLLCEAEYDSSPNMCEIMDTWARRQWLEKHYITE